VCNTPGSQDASTPESLAISLRLYDEDGRCLMEIREFKSKRAERKAFQRYIEASQCAAAAPPSSEPHQAAADEDDENPTLSRLLYEGRMDPAADSAAPGQFFRHAPAALVSAAALEAQDALAVVLAQPPPLLSPLINECSCAYAWLALRTIALSDGIFGSAPVTAGAVLPLKALHTGCPSVKLPHMRRLLVRCAELAAEGGFLMTTPETESWTVTPPGAALTMADAEAIAQRALNVSGPACVELALAARCGPPLADIMREACNPLTLIFPSDEKQLSANNLYRDTPLATYFNGLVAQSVLAFAHARQPNQTLRLLEVGAGTGGTTSTIVPLLAAEPALRGLVSYTFTDVSPVFLPAARKRFEAYDWITYQTLDIERDPSEQGFIVHDYDIVVACNVLHATRCMRDTMTHILQLLAAGGAVVVLEQTVANAWVDITFGCLKGWWAYEDLDLRPAHPLLTRAKWTSLMANVGYAETQFLPGPDAQTAQAVIIGRAPAVLPVAPVLATRLRPFIPSGKATPSFLVFADGGGRLPSSVGARLAALCQSVLHPGACILVTPPARERTLQPGCYEVVAPGHFAVAPTDKAALERLFTEALGPTLLADMRALFFCWGLDLPATPAPAANGASLVTALAPAGEALLCTTQALLAAAEHAAHVPRLVLLTRDAQVLRDAEGPARANTGLLQAPLIGMLKGIEAEHPELNALTIDLDPIAVGPARLDAILQAVLVEAVVTQPREQEVTLRGERRWVARLHRLPLPPRDSAALAVPTASPVSAAGTYLITGGLGGLGLVFGRWLLKLGAGAVVLAGRRTPTEKAAAELAAMAAEFPGARVEAALCDVSRYTDVAALVGRLRDEAAAGHRPPLRGVLHSVGVLQDGILTRQDWARFEAVFAPKIDGAWYLHTLTRDLPLDSFIMFSSFASLLGSAGQVNHGAANAFLDRFAAYRRALGLPALTVQWGAWAEVGALVNVTDQRMQRAKSLGEVPFSNRVGVDAFEWLFRASCAGAIQPVHVAGIGLLHWDRTLPHFHSPQSYHDLIRAEVAPRVLTPRASAGPSTRGGAPAATTADSATNAVALVRRVKRGGAAASVKETVLEVVRTIMGLREGKTIEDEQPLQSLGMDSLMAVELRNHLMRQFSIKVGLRAGSLSRTLSYPLLHADPSYALVRLFPHDSCRRRYSTISRTWLLLPSTSAPCFQAAARAPLVKARCQQRPPYRRWPPSRLRRRTERRPRTRESPLLAWHAAFLVTARLPRPSSR